MTIAVIGLGLIGGSLAKVIKERTTHKVLGFDKNESTLVMAYENEAIDDVCTSFDDVDFIFIALNPVAAVDFIKAYANTFPLGSTVIDLCGVKRFVCKSVQGIMPKGVTFVGGHPMAGRECSGFENSSATMFDNASMILTPDDDTLLEQVESLCEFFLSLGFGHCEVTTDKQHDEMIAYTSQLAHIVSSAYVKNPIARKFLGFSAGSFADMTRVAKLNEDMWTELFMLNGDFLKKQIDVMINNLSSFQSALEKNDADAIKTLLRDGREMKEALEAELTTF